MCVKERINKSQREGSTKPIMSNNNNVNKFYWLNNTVSSFQSFHFNNGWEPEEFSESDEAFIERCLQREDELEFVVAEEETTFTMLTLEGYPEKGDENRPDMSCVICLENKKNVMLQPCSHIVYCVECARKDLCSDTCPICRGKYTNAQVVFF